MIISKLKKKLTLISISLIVLGFIISIFGFILTDCNISAYEIKDGFKWYRTINFDGRDYRFDLSNF